MIHTTVDLIKANSVPCLAARMAWPSGLCSVAKVPWPQDKFSQSVVTEIHTCSSHLVATSFWQLHHLHVFAFI